MPGAPLRPDQNRAALIALARTEGFDVDLGADLDGAEFRLGWENVVLDTPDGWIIRFPRDEEFPFAREMKLLSRLRPRLPAPIPAVVSTGQQTQVAVYRRLDGQHLEVSRYEAAPAAVRDRVADRLARFLAAMHEALSPAEIAEIGVPTTFVGEVHTEVPPLPEQLVPSWRTVRDELQQRLDASPNRPVLLHDDFHLGNLVLDSELGDLAGVWDFSCVAVGDLSIDFRYLVGDSWDLATRIASAYAARTGREVDLGLAATALQLEEVSDALEEGRDPAPYLTAGDGRRSR